MAVQEPNLLQFNTALADELGLGVAELPSQDLAQIFSGQKLLAGSRPLAQAYAGHQFGGFFRSWATDAACSWVRWRVLMDVAATSR